MTNFSPYISSREGTGAEAASGLEAATTPLQAPIQAQLASRASNAADGIVPLGIVPHDGVIAAAYLTPKTSQAGSATHFANVTIVNLGPTAATSTVLASRTLSAAGQGVAALNRGSMALSSGTALSVSAGDQLGVSYASQGNGIALVDHQVAVMYRRR